MGRPYTSRLCAKRHTDGFTARYIKTRERFFPAWTRSRHERPTKSTLMAAFLSDQLDAVLAPEHFTI